MRRLAPASKDARAKTFLWLAFGSGLAIILIYVGFLVFAISMDGNDAYYDGPDYGESYDDGYYDD